MTNNTRAIKQTREQNKPKLKKERKQQNWYLTTANLVHKQTLRTQKTRRLRTKQNTTQQNTKNNEKNQNKQKTNLDK